MAGDYLRLKRSMWRDPDFRQLPERARWAYVTIVGQSKLSPCGVLDFTPNRVAADMGCAVDELLDAVQVLIDRRYVAVDEETSELAVRTYVRHDVNTNHPKMVTAVRRAMGQVLSRPIVEWIEANLPPEMAVIDQQSISDGSDPDHTHNADRSSLPPIHPHPAGASAEAAAAAALTIVADLETTAEVAARRTTSDPVRKPERYRERILERLTTDRLAEAVRFATEHPDASPDQLAGMLTPATEPPSTGAGWAPDVECDTCCGAWFVYLDGDDSQAYRCPSCYPAELGDAVLPTTAPSGGGR